MKTLIIYASKTGTTKKCASLLAANLGAENCELFDIASGEPTLSGFDCCALGSYLRMGVIDKSVAAFIEKHRDELFSMRFGLFLCGCLADKVSDAIVKNFSDDLLEKAACVEFFGGEMAVNKQKGVGRLIINSFMKIAKTDPGFSVLNAVDPAAISAFAAELSAE